MKYLGILALLCGSMLVWNCGDTISTDTTIGEGEGEGEGETDTGEDTEYHGLGAACHCEGNKCQQLGVEVPNGGTKVGCEDVPTDVVGAELVCLRSYEGDLANDTYFAKGYCALMATKCTGSALICGSAVFGKYLQLVACPAGSVMLETSVAVSAVGQTATVMNKICVRSCTQEGQCREDVHDDALDEATQYQCMTHEEAQFCYDPRNLPDDYGATAF